MYTDPQFSPYSAYLWEEGGWSEDEDRSHWTGFWHGWGSSSFWPGEHLLYSNLLHHTFFFICVVCNVCVLFCNQNIYKNSLQNNHLDCEGRSSLAEADCTVLNPIRSCQGTLSRINETSQLNGPSKRGRKRELKRMKYKGENGVT